MYVCLDQVIFVNQLSVDVFHFLYRLNNMLFFVGHWDGWQPFSTSSCGCGATEVSIATMSKVDRCHTEEVYVVGFVPSYLLPKKRPISLDPFLEPLISDIEGGFIRGIHVDYCIPICGQDAGSAVTRHLILCWSGDHNGQCEVGKFVKCGKSGCRRCKTTSMYMDQISPMAFISFCVSLFFAGIR